MVANFLTRKRPLGFTLVELLIVVAIIGVLSTIGVPTFRRMVQKSKKSEAKVNLGGFYTAEQAFFSEYGAFGNNISKVGFEVDGTNLMYVIGFPAGGGVTVAGPCTGVAAVRPQQDAATSPIGANLNNVYPSYYTSWLTGGSTIAGVACPNGGATCPSVAGNQIMTGNCLGGDVVSSAGADNDTFLATASGVIAPGVNKVNGTDTNGKPYVDQWSINEQRVMSNVADGVK